ncbi:MAG: ABC transporter permease [bacterium]
MFKSYLKIAFRNFLKYKAYSFINVAGLALGLGCCILMLLYVQDELSYDRFHVNAKQIYRLICEESQEGRVRRVANTFAPMAPALRAAFPEISKIVRLFPHQVVVARDQDRRFPEKRFFFVDSTFFEVFTFSLRHGDARTALDQPNALILTPATAQKYFGAENPVGQSLTIENQHDFVITGVLEEVPPRSHFDFDFLANMNSVNALIGTWVLNHGWYYPPMYTYILLPPQEAPEKISQRMPEFVHRNFPKTLASYQKLQLQAMTAIHLHSDLENEIAPTSNIAYVYIFSAIAAFILAIAAINFMNLATARSANRAREVGLRKVVGAEKTQLIRQFLGESLFYAGLALFFALVLVEIFLPLFNSLSGKQLDLRYSGNWTIVFGMLALTFVVGILAGSYPAFFLARFRPVQVLKGKALTGVAGRTPLRLRSLLVIVQFVVSVVLMIVTWVVQEQLHYIQNKRLGFDKSHLLVVPIRDEAVQESFASLKNQLSTVAGISHISAISNFPWEKGYYDFFVRAEGMGPEEKLNLPTVLVEYDFIPAFGMEVVAGRDFSKEHMTDAQGAFILNEAAVKRFGWDSAIGKKIEMEGVAAGRPRSGRVVGVVKDFHLRSLHHTIEPLVMLIAPAAYYLDNMAIRLEAHNIAQTLAALERKWRELVPHRPFEYFFMDEAFEGLYRREQRLAQIFRYFSALALVVGCLGLFGLASFVAEQKTKEIGIRKVLGASVAGIVGFLAKDLVKLVLVANLIAWPVAYFAMHTWLQDFAYRVDLRWWTFAVATLLALAIALVTVSYQTLKAALANPVEALRCE